MATNTGFTRNNLSFGWTGVSPPSMGLENARLVTVMTTLREFFQKKSNADLASQFSRFDADGSGVDKVEFLCGVLLILDKIGSHDLLQILLQFERLDVDGSGKLIIDKTEHIPTTYHILRTSYHSPLSIATGELVTHEIEHIPTTYHILRTSHHSLLSIAAGELVIHEIEHILTWASRRKKALGLVRNARIRLDSEDDLWTQVRHWLVSGRR